MARSKNRVLAYDAKNADEVTVQLEMDNGEVIQARYKRVIWLIPTKKAAKEFDAVFSSHPVQTVGFGKKHPKAPKRQ